MARAGRGNPTTRRSRHRGGMMFPHAAGDVIALESTPARPCGNSRPVGHQAQTTLTHTRKDNTPSARPGRSKRSRQAAFARNTRGAARWTFACGVALSKQQRSHTQGGLKLRFAAVRRSSRRRSLPWDDGYDLTGRPQHGQCLTRHGVNKQRYSPSPNHKGNVKRLAPCGPRR